jgi:hypothetical protein
VAVAARVDGQVVFEGNTTVSAVGVARFSFALPKRMKDGQGNLTLTVRDGGVVETAAKTLPILQNRLDVSFFPEGGDLVAGVPQRVYLEALTPWGKPADVRGAVLDSAGVAVASVQTEHEGRGRFEFVPRLGERYVLQVREPAGITESPELPQAVSAGVALRVDDPSLASGAPVAVSLVSPTTQRVLVVVSQREVELSQAWVDLGANVPLRVELPLWRAAAGVLTVTVREPSGRPLAERLVLPAPRANLQVDITAHQKRYAPGGQVELTVRTRDESGRPVPAHVGLSVTDAANIDLLEDRDTPPGLRAMVLLEPEVQELKDAQAYFADQLAGAQNIDLLLGCQGWRRFALYDVAKFREKYGDDALRVLALRDQSLAMLGTGAGGGGLGMVEDFAGHGAAVGGMAMPAAQPAMPGDALADAEDEVLAAEHEAPPSEVAAAPVQQMRAAPAEAFGGEILAEPVAEAAKMDARLERAPAQGRRAVGARGPMRDDMFWLHQGAVAVREYAHPVRANRAPNERVDFTETVYWSAGIVTDNRGEATVTFHLSDSVTSFRATARAFDARGALGDGEALVESVEPFYAEAKLPLEVTAGDEVLLPVSWVNNTDAAMSQATAEVTAPEGIAVSALPSQTLAAGGRERELASLRVGAKAQSGAVVVQARAGAYSDKVERTLTVKPLGFPIEFSQGAVLGPQAAFKIDVVIPPDAAPGSVRSSLRLFASPEGNLTAAMERLLQEPYGCFEQTSSTTYPAVMAQQYFTTAGNVDPALVARGRDIVGKGHDRLVGFECKKRGYEWFGEDPGHEALTAYGLLEFTDMAKIYPVDAAMLSRTREWLMASRDGKGGFRRERRTLHTWLAEPTVSNAYILWALLEAAAPAAELRRELDSLATAAVESGDAYVLGLASNALFIAGRKDEARSMAKKLASAQREDGVVTGAKTSIVGSEGVSLDVETTALAALAWMREPEAFPGEVALAMQWLTESCKDGRYGATQSTVLALRAILAHARLHSESLRAGSVQVTVDGYPMGGPTAVGPGSTGVVQLADIAEMLSPGRHVVEVKMTDGSPMPMSLTVNYHAATPPSAENAALDLTVSLADSTVKEGNATEVRVAVKNRRKEALSSPVAIVGIPGGLEVDHEHLKELKSAGAIAAYEVLGRDAVLYWRVFDTNQEKRVALRVLAAIPGKYTAPASRAYPYYGDENKTWQKGVTVEITPAQTSQR